MKGLLKFLGRYGLDSPYFLMVEFVILFFVLLVISPNLLIPAVQFALQVSIIWIPLLLIWVFANLWFDFVRANYNASREYVLLEIKMPAEIEQTPKAMALFLTAIHNTGREFTPILKYIKGQTRPTFSLELVSQGGSVHFYIRTEAGFVPILKTKMSGYYPGVEVVEVDDYVHDIEYDQDEMDLFGCEFDLTDDQHLPIPTYDQFDAEDPLTHMLSYMSSVGEGHYVWLQFVIRGSKGDQKKGWFSSYNKIKDEGQAAIKETLEKTKDKEGVLRPNLLTDADKQLVKAIEQVLDSDIFEVGIRGMYFANKGTFEASHIGGLLSIFKPFSSKSLNGIGPARYLVKYSYPWQDYKEFFQNKERRKLFQYYRERAYFYLPYKQKPNFMSTAELATIFHLPRHAKNFVGIIDSGPRKANPPSNLPV